ncbi:unnamed protein product [Protopolystoma xenopodis]|uniref:Uncharacterized protein n=1 Tax=Protopolystoma xenopodis TaxID=117903 RepID=A0A448WLA5_9PLAT|nr:unnamed protein product [Protopolystoma xenopodis]
MDCLAQEQDTIADSFLHSVTAASGPPSSCLLGSDSLSSLQTLTNHSVHSPGQPISASVLPAQPNASLAFGTPTQRHHHSMQHRQLHAYSFHPHSQVYLQTPMSCPNFNAHNIPSTGHSSSLPGTSSPPSQTIAIPTPPAITSHSDTIIADVLTQSSPQYKSLIDDGSSSMQQQQHHQVEASVEVGTCGRSSPLKLLQNPEFLLMGDNSLLTNKTSMTSRGATSPLKAIIRDSIEALKQPIEVNTSISRRSGQFKSLI